VIRRYIQQQTRTAITTPLFLNSIWNQSLIFFSGIELKRSLISFTLLFCKVFSLVSRNVLFFRFSHTASETLRYFGISSEIDYKQTILRVRNCNLKRDWSSREDEREPAKTEKISDFTPETQRGVMDYLQIPVDPTS